jgi:hypothetical protein
MVRALWLLAIVPASGVAACTCAASFNACHETSAASVVFAGTVESIEPNFLNNWNPEQRADLLRLNEEYARTRQNFSAAALSNLKAAYLRVFPNLPEDRKRKLHAAKTMSDLASLFYRVLDNGKYIRFRVRESFKHLEDEDQEPETLEIWTPFGECGYDFQIGETYLVYADGDEESDILSTGVCSRTKRITDAGEDLGFLFFLKHDAKRSSRLEGYATSDPLFQAEFDKLRDLQSVKSPAANVVVALESAGGNRYVRTGTNGRFVFDGLAAGDYTLSAFTPGYPREVRVLAAPKQIKVEAKACMTQIVLIHK